MAGGGDQTKPISQEMRKILEKKGKKPSSPDSPKPKKVRGGPEKFPRVHRMFTLPMDERWRLASTFTKEEMEYSRRLAKRKLQEEWKMDDILDWDGEGEDKDWSGQQEPTIRNQLGDSDDGTI